MTLRLKWSKIRCRTRLIQFQLGIPGVSLHVDVGQLTAIYEVLVRCLAVVVWSQNAPVRC